MLLQECQRVRPSGDVHPQCPVFAQEVDRVRLQPLQSDAHVSQGSYTELGILMGRVRIMAAVAQRQSSLYGGLQRGVMRSGRLPMTNH